jgi:hypothetical protein
MKIRYICLRMLHGHSGREAFPHSLFNNSGRFSPSPLSVEDCLYVLLHFILFWTLSIFFFNCLWDLSYLIYLSMKIWNMFKDVIRAYWDGKYFFIPVQQNWEIFSLPLPSPSPISRNDSISNLFFSYCTTEK